MANITLSMIVKNEEKYLQDCLESVKDIVSEIVIVDTGSTDRTIEIAKQYNAKIFNFEWINDFSAARNYALEKTSGDWVLYLDADERLAPEAKEEILRKTEGQKKTAFYCTVKSMDSKGGRENSIRYTRLFAYSPEIKFSGKVHEQIEDSLKKNNYLIADSKILINHIGYDISDQGKKEKAKRNLELLISDYRNNPSAYCEFQLAHTYSVLDEKENAAKYFKRAAESHKLERIYRADCYASLALIAHSNHKTQEAEKYILQSFKLYDKQPFAYLLAAKISYRLENFTKAEERCKKAFELNKNIMNGNGNSGLEIYIDPEEIIYFGLTIAKRNKSDVNNEFYNSELEKIYKDIYPDGIKKYSELMNKITCNIQLEKDEIDLLEKVTKSINSSYFLLLLTEYKDYSTKLEILKRYSSKFPEDAEIVRTKVKVLDDIGEVDEAIELIEKNKNKDHVNPAIFFNLIALYIKKGDFYKTYSTLEYLESNYNNIPEVALRVSTLKEKLKAFASKKN